MGKINYLSYIMRGIALFAACQSGLLYAKDDPSAIYFIIGGVVMMLIA